MRFSTPWIMVALLMVPLEVQAGKGAPHVSAPKPPHLSKPRPVKISTSKPPKVAKPKPPKVSKSKPPKVVKSQSTQLPALTPLPALSPLGSQNSAPTARRSRSAIARSYSYRSYHRSYRGNRRRSYYPVRSYRRAPVARSVSPQVQRLAKLKADLDTLAPRSPITLADKETLKNDLLAVTEGSAKPGSSVVQTLANDLADALVKRRRPAVDTLDLANHLKRVMNGGKASEAEVLGAVTGGEAILKAAGVSQNRLESIRTDLNAVASDAQSHARTRNR